MQRKDGSTADVWASTQTGVVIKDLVEGYVMTDFDISCNLELYMITQLIKYPVAGSEFAFCLRCKLPIFQRTDALESEKCVNLKRKFEMVVDLVEE